MNREFELKYIDFKKPQAITQNFLNQMVNLDMKEMTFFWEKEAWMGYLRKQRFHLIICLSEGEIIGLAIGRLSSFYDYFDLDKIIIYKKYLSIGLGSRIYNTLEEVVLEEVSSMKLKSIKFLLEVSSANKRAFRFYKKYGYALNYEAKNYYSDGNNALKMEKFIYL
jgi:ribosomal protein S18 acetylase RimI-like enzyme